MLRRGRRRPRRAPRLRGAVVAAAVAAAVALISGGGARPGAAPGRVREVPSLKWTPRAARDKADRTKSGAPSRVAATARSGSRALSSSDASASMPPAMFRCRGEPCSMYTRSALPGPRAPMPSVTARLGLAHVEQVPMTRPRHVRAFTWLTEPAPRNPR